MEQGAELMGRVITRAGRWDRPAPGRDDKGGNGGQGGMPPPPSSHRNTNHSTPIVAARTIDRTTLRLRGPAGTGIAGISGAPDGTPAIRAGGGGAGTRLAHMGDPR